MTAKPQPIPTATPEAGASRLASPLTAVAAPAGRLLSLDVLRGFDMMWIVGADALGGAFSHLRGGAVTQLLGRELSHVDWAGLHFYDLIFPLFVFLVGVAIPFSLDKAIATGGRAAAVRRILRRTALLYVLGLLYYGGFSAGWAQIRLLGVLQRIALCYGAASLLYLAFRARGLVVTCVALLVGYWALLRFVPVPGFGPGDFREGHNLANWIDAHYLPLRQWDGDHDPEGLLSTFPAIATCLLGVFAGRWLRDPRLSAGKRVGMLVVTGVALVIGGVVWGTEFPVIKKIWSSSFVLLAGGWSMLLLGIFYLVLDVWQIRAWAKPFAYLGANALTIYVLSAVVDFGNLSARLVGGPVTAGLDALWIGLGGIVLALTSIALCVLVCAFLYQRKIFLRL